MPKFFLNNCMSYEQTTNVLQHTTYTGKENRGTESPVIYFLLDGAGGKQPVDGDRPRLANAPCPLPRLRVSAWVPVGVEYYNSIGAGQVDAEATNTSRQQKQEQRLVLHIYQKQHAGCTLLQI